MQRGGDDGAGDEDNCEDGDETGNRQEGVQGSHDGHSGVLRSTRSMEKTDHTIAVFLRAYAYLVDNLNAA